MSYSKLTTCCWDKVYLWASIPVAAIATAHDKLFISHLIRIANFCFASWPIKDPSVSCKEVAVLYTSVKSFFCWHFVTKGGLEKPGNNKIRDS